MNHSRRRPRNDESMSQGDGFIACALFQPNYVRTCTRQTCHCEGALSDRRKKATSDVPGLPRPPPLSRQRPRNDESMSYERGIEKARRCSAVRCVIGLRRFRPTRCCRCVVRQPIEHKVFVILAGVLTYAASSRFHTLAIIDADFLSNIFAVRDCRLTPQIGARHLPNR